MGGSNGASVLYQDSATIAYINIYELYTPLIVLVHFLQTCSELQTMNGHHPQEVSSATNRCKCMCSDLTSRDIATALMCMHASLSLWGIVIRHNSDIESVTPPACLQ